MLSPALLSSSELSALEKQNKFSDFVHQLRCERWTDTATKNRSRSSYYIMFNRGDEMRIWYFRRRRLLIQVQDKSRTQFRQRFPRTKDSRTF
jgi:hypothetical protein